MLITDDFFVVFIIFLGFFKIFTPPDLIPTPLTFEDSSNLLMARECTVGAPPHHL